jgi:glycosyltransferase 2 family protein
MSEVQHAPSTARRYALTVVKLAVSIALLAVLFSRIDVNRLWHSARQASVPWLFAALGLYLVTITASTWRWKLLLNAQNVDLNGRYLLGSYLVATFFNNFLPSNIGGDVIRIRDSAKAAGSKTLATTIVLTDRVIGLIGLVLISALGATAGSASVGRAPSPIWPAWLWVGFALAAGVSAPAVLAPAGLTRLLQPLTALHPEWIGERIDKMTSALERFRDRPAALGGCFLGALCVQALLITYYVAVVRALHIDVRAVDLAVIVPISFVIQMVPVSVNGFGVREATFSLYFSRLGVPIESAVLMSLVAAALVILFSLTGAAVYVARGHH